MLVPNPFSTRFQILELAGPRVWVGFRAAGPSTTDIWDTDLVI